MTILLLGLLLFLGVHSVRALAPNLRDAGIARLGLGPWKGLYSLLSIVGFVLIVIGYGEAREDPLLLWAPPLWLRHLAALFTLPAFILLVAAYVPNNHLKARLGHPMLLAVKLWALGHLLAVGWLHAVVLLAAFLAWAVIAFAAARRRDRADAAAVTRAPSVPMSALCVIVGAAAWGLVVFHLHARLIGVAPFG
jgi:uncharacterized membrane protein